jgi:PPOX class probable F420-dependent enzyme
MPKGPVPDRFSDLLRGDALGHLATVDERGRPQVNPVWFLWDGERQQLYLSVRGETRKYRNLRRHPHVALSVLDREQPDRYVELRGEVVAFALYLDLTFVNQLARKYTGADYTRGHAGEERYKVTIQVDSWTGQEG